MRLLVLDSSRLLASLVRRIVPEDVEVVATESFDEVIAELLGQAPDALIVNVTPASLPWQRLQALCQRHKPFPIPVLYESSIFDSPQEAGIAELNGNSSFATKPFRADELRAYVQQLLELASSRRPDVEDRQERIFH